MAKKFGLAILLFGMARVASAGSFITHLCDDVSWLDDTPLCRDVERAPAPRYTPVPKAAPEIDPASAIAGLTLLLGGVAVIRGRRV